MNNDKRYARARGKRVFCVAFTEIIDGEPMLNVFSGWDSHVRALKWAGDVCTENRPRPPFLITVRNIAATSDARDALAKYFGMRVV